MKKGIAVAGNILMDYYKKIAIYPDHSTLVTITDINQAPGGAAYNSAVDLARIDPELDLTVIGIVGNDEAGQAILAKYRQYANIHCDQITFGSATSFTDVLEDVTHHTRTFFQFRGANAELDNEHFDFNYLNADLIHIGYILLLDGLDAEDPEFGTVMARVLHRAKLAGMRTSIDIVSEASDRFKTKVPPALKFVDYCIINEQEASKTCGIPVRDDQGRLLVNQMKRVCEELFLMGVSEWVVIHAREGAVGMTRSGEVVCLPSLKIDPQSIKGTTGAGDAFLSGTLYGAWKRDNLRSAIELGIAAAASSLTVANSTDGVGEETRLRSFYANNPKEVWPGFEI